MIDEAALNTNIERRLRPRSIYVASSPPETAIGEKRENSELQSFVLLGNLRVLDLSYNNISTLPSNFVQNLEYLKGLTKLTKVDFRGNPCSAWFPEYASVLVGNAVASGQHLHQLDAEAIAPRSEKEITDMAAQVIANLDQYDSTYMERQEAEATRPRLAKYAIKTALASDDGDITIGRLSGILERLLTVSADGSAELGATFYDICFRARHTISTH
ncbi:leucine rich repeat containing protein, putative [Eimeria praecox]|uniref:Leucine rich repeat containing protein, putative n=1 Tax=Eimeria praecox TaxID=51316 RepID=U6H2U0_9EIME|nr:leucine rich repeat containing protein, putative [Eimeria praecox]